MMKIVKNIWLLVCMMLMLSSVSMACYAKDKPAYKQYPWSFTGLFGTYDLPSVQRGYLVYRKACASCHSVQYMRYADLQQMGLTLDQIDKIAKTDQVLDGKDASGKDRYRPATVVDYLPAPYSNQLMAKSVNAGKVPLDFSRYGQGLRKQADYIMAILMGYQNPPAGFKPDQEGMVYNRYFPNHQIAMRSPLIKDGVKYPGGTPATIEQQAKDVTTFLSWTAHPHLIERHRIGIMVMIYLAFIAILTLLVKRKVWSNVK
ncbi:cytochrome c1 [Commensalibacter nepenthis]|uniref:Cytochrome c1 n=1 Tax=Commensalibacter nepenthis TaxID=3043872 RepID=A0ABT6Q9S6_9PROT|nr:cytochrome c1 [Commensalibacter sp. TBRC 10068]MDI2113657.1 cytochrome c1 [Commensalibacter sp. TBRC 10068]